MASINIDIGDPKNQPDDDWFIILLFSIGIMTIIAGLFIRS